MRCFVLTDVVITGFDLCTVGYATTNDPTKKECYNEQFLSIKSGCYNEHRCYSERGLILSADVARACA